MYITDLIDKRQDQLLFESKEYPKAPFTFLCLLRYNIQIKFMADIQQNTGGGGGSATTILVTLVIVLIIGAVFYFGFGRGNWGGDGGTNIDINATVPEGSGLPGGPAE